MPVIIVGMHRSGTSALTRCLNLMGLGLGDESHLIPAGPDNPRGFWENRRLSEFNERILGAMGGAWSYPPILRGDWVEQPRIAELRAEARRLLDEEGLDLAASCWKDPRASLTLPFWRGILKSRVVAVFIHRNPLEIWKSLEKRNQFDKQRAFSLWAIYNNAALSNLSGLAVCTLSYEALLRNPLESLSRIERFLEREGIPGLRVPRAEDVEGFLSRDLRHWQAADDEILQDPDFSPIHQSIYSAIGRLPAETQLLRQNGLLSATNLGSEHLIAAVGELKAMQRELSAAAAYQKVIEEEIERARTYQAGLEERIRALEHRLVVSTYPIVDVLVVSYNSSRWIAGFLDSLRQLDYPAERLRLVFVDNGSTDDTVDKFKVAAATLSVPSHFIETGKNLGFTGGYETAFRYAEGDYSFVVNLDTCIAPDAVKKLVEVLENDPRVGIAEARQSPREHPKYYDAVTGETSWCSGACMMIRPAALRQVGDGFEKSFFMYAEDVDLSWRMWLHGWKCVYVLDAVVEHFTEDLDPNKRPMTQHYYTMRNGALMRAMFGSNSELLVHYAAMLRLALLSRNPLWHKRLTFKAIFASLLKLPAAIRGREFRGRLGRHPWVFFNGWLFGRHARDLACSNALRACHADLIAQFPAAKKELSQDLSLESHLSVNPGVSIGGETMPAILAYSSAKLHYPLTLPKDAVLIGAVAAPPDTWTNKAAGRFTVYCDGVMLWQRDLNLHEWSDRRWVDFEIPLNPIDEDRPVMLTLGFEGVANLVWGLWGRVRVARAERAEAGDDPVDRLTGLAASIVIPTHNRAGSVPQVIRRLMTQDVPAERFQVVVVNSASSDHTTDVLAGLMRTYSNLTALRCEKPGAAAARNMGLDVAEAPLVVLLDDDILVGSDFVRRILRAHQERPDRVLLGRIVAPWDDSTDPFERYLLHEQDVNIYDFADNSNVPANYFYTACVAIPRDVLGATRFDEGFSVYGVEDIDFGFRLLDGQRRMVFLPDLAVLHDYHPVYADYRRKKYKAGYSLGYFHARQPDQAKKLTFGRRFVRHYPLLRVARVVLAPFAKLAYFWERIRYRTGPVNRLLHRWWYLDLRIRLYAGLLRFKRGQPPP